MLDFLLSPFKAVYNLNTYTKAIKQSAWKTLLFLVYLLVMFTALFLAVIAIKTPSLTPIFEKSTEQVAKIMPDIEVKDGRVIANNDEYYEITMEDLLDPNDYDYRDIPQQILDQKIVFDTARTEPVYPTKMQQENISVLITDKTVYMLANGQVETRDFKINKDETFSINGQYLLENKDKIVQIINKVIVTSVIIITTILIAFFMAITMILAIVAVAISQLFTRTNLYFGEVLSISCYLLAPAFFLLLIGFILLLDIFNIILWTICFAMLMFYAQLILNKIKFHERTDED